MKVRCVKMYRVIAGKDNIPGWERRYEQVFDTDNEEQKRRLGAFCLMGIEGSKTKKEELDRLLLLLQHTGIAVYKPVSAEHILISMVSIREEEGQSPCGCS